MAKKLRKMKKTKKTKETKKAKKAAPATDAEKAAAKAAKAAKLKAEAEESRVNLEDSAKQLKVKKVNTASKRKYISIFQRNAEQSPLLRLPGELRNRIYEFALGGRLIHVVWADHVRDSVWIPQYCEPNLHYHSCTVSETLQGWYQRFRALNEDTNNNTLFRGPHQYCRVGWDYCLQLYFEPEERPAFKEPKLDLQLLRVCRQINSETRLIPYMWNTISVNAVLDYHYLRKCLQVDQLRAIRHLHITIETRIRDWRWKEIFSLETVKSFRGLRSLYVDIRIHRYRAYERVYSMSWQEKTNLCLTNFMVFQWLPLETVRVIVGEHHYTHFYYQTQDCGLCWSGHNDDPWLSAREKQEWAAALEAKLLAPWDQVAYDQKQAEMRAQWERRVKAREEAG